MHRYRKFLDFSKERFEKLKIIIKDFPKPIFNEPEWGIPKGRRKNKESNFDCANREFCEETGLSRLNYEILKPYCLYLSHYWRHKLATYRTIPNLT